MTHTHHAGASARSWLTIPRQVDARAAAPSIGVLMSDLEDRMAEALWVADDPFRSCGVYGPFVPIAWTDADEDDRDLYRNKAKVVIAQLELTEEWANSWEQQGDLDIWYPGATNGGSREIAETNMAIDRNHPNPRFRNMKLLRRWVSKWWEAT